MSRPWILGVNGGIGAGKSSFCRLLAALGGWPFLEADRYGQEALFPCHPIARTLVDRFGERITAPEGGIRRDLLARLVFEDPAALADLNALTHPWILRRFFEEASVLWNSGATDIILFDAALLADWLDRWPREWALRVVTVTAPIPLRLTRLRARGMDEDEARRRMERQRTDQELRSRADWVVENDGSWAGLTRRAAEIAGALARARGAI